LKHDPLTRLPNRIGLETTLCQWWRQHVPQNHELGAALLDLDGFGRLNLDHGCLPGDRILYHIAQFLLGSGGSGGLVGRMAGQQFLLVTRDQGPRALTRDIEMLRQSIERMTFTRQEQAIRLTASAAVTAVAAGETEESLLERLEATMAAARQSGRNHCFFHDGQQAQPVNAPDLGAEYRDILV